MTIPETDLAVGWSVAIPTPPLISHREPVWASIRELRMPILKQERRQRAIERSSYPASCGWAVCRDSYTATHFASGAGTGKFPGSSGAESAAGATQASHSMVKYLAGRGRSVAIPISLLILHRELVWASVREVRMPLLQQQRRQRVTQRSSIRQVPGAWSVTTSISVYNEQAGASGKVSGKFGRRFCSGNVAGEQLRGQVSGKSHIDAGAARYAGRWFSQQESLRISIW